VGIVKARQLRSTANLGAATALIFAATAAFVPEASAHDDDHERLQGQKMEIRVP
jgi:hypothetical protein